MAFCIFAAAGIWYFAAMGRSFRSAASTRPFPGEWRRILTERVRYYRNLAPDRQAAFEREIAGFIHENRFVGVAGVEVTDELKLLAAASAVMLLFGRPGRRYPRIPEILFYPRAFDEDYQTKGHDRNIAGLNHPWGTVILSVPSLLQSFASDSDGYHVGLHEFAHALDLSGQEWDGIPVGLNPRLARPWSRLILDEMEKAGEGRSVLGEYAGTNEAEAFAVAVEVYFERPEQLRKANPPLYSMLRGYFGDPRGREEPRG